MKRWKVILAAALIFATGVVTGAFAFWAAQERFAPEDRRQESFIDLRFDALKRMKAELDLSPEQTERIDAILHEGRKRMKQVWETTCQPEVRQEMKRVRDCIYAELNDAQRAKYDELLRRSKERKPQYSEPPSPAPNAGPRG